MAFDSISAPGGGEADRYKAVLDRITCRCSADLSTRLADMSMAATCRENMSMKLAFIDIYSRGRDRDRGFGFINLLLIGLILNHSRWSLVSRVIFGEGMIELFLPTALFDGRGGSKGCPEECSENSFLFAEDAVLDQLGYLMIVQAISSSALFELLRGGGRRSPEVKANDPRAPG